MNQPKPFRLHGSPRSALRTEWETVKQRVAAQNGQPTAYTITPLPKNPTKLQAEWHATQVNVAKSLGLVKQPSGKGGIYGDGDENERQEEAE
ncbi:hypothetical protein [Pseudoxanthomonas sacheonensis]|uniref:hypothetical protein n=1 Tax=Pseudoxanthomonas sacheonensis TaxID=443615 RepID=UPI0013D607FC|nr:hypothetical protein [Pseudoxanthomonas sacheonensis]